MTKAAAGSMRAGSPDGMRTSLTTALATNASPGLAGTPLATHLRAPMSLVPLESARRARNEPEPGTLGPLARGL
jgi:hypothetical protein